MNNSTTTTEYRDHLIAVLTEYADLCDKLDALSFERPPRSVLMHEGTPDAIVKSRGDFIEFDGITVSYEHGHCYYNVRVTDSSINGVQRSGWGKVIVTGRGDKHLFGYSNRLTRPGQFGAEDLSESARRKINDMLVEAVTYRGGSVEHLAEVEPYWTAYTVALNERPSISRNPRHAISKIEGSL